MKPPALVLALASSLALALPAAAASTDPTMECTPIAGDLEQVENCWSHDPDTGRTCTSYRAVLAAPLVQVCSTEDGGDEACTRGCCVPLG